MLVGEGPAWCEGVEPGEDTGPSMRLSVACHLLADVNVDGGQTSAFR